MLFAEDVAVKVIPSLPMCHSQGVCVISGIAVEILLKKS